ncbi:MAG: ATP-binding protein [Sphingopyxis sp.]
MSKNQRNLPIGSGAIAVDNLSADGQAPDADGQAPDADGQAPDADGQASDADGQASGDVVSGHSTRNIRALSKLTFGTLTLGKLAPSAEIVTIAVLIVVSVVTAFVLPALDRGQLLSPTAVALLLVANLLPAMALLVLVGRRFARRRVNRHGGREAGLHTRLVALFSVTAAVPMMLVVIFASFLFQSGMDFWFSDRSRGMFESAVSVAQNYFDNEKRNVGANTLAIATDLRAQLSRSSIESDAFYEFYLQQVVVRELSESAIIQIGADGIARTSALIDPNNRPAATRITPQTLRRLRAGETLVTNVTDDGVEAIAPLIPDRQIYLYAARGSTVTGIENIRRARSVFADFNALLARSRALQFQFIAALYLGSLTLIGLAIFIALLLADRIVRPIDELVVAARRVAAGDLETRVKLPDSQPDEIDELGSAFNGMTERLGEQTRDLLFANDQIENRRAFIEAVLSAVTSGVISIDDDKRIRLVNEAAATMLADNNRNLVGTMLADSAPELAAWVDSGGIDPELSLTIMGEPKSWTVKMADDEHGVVITFEDITRQLLDQRRAAWSDVARRIAHEIKNPLTPIQLAAERLQRRFGESQGEEVGTFRKLTSTIIRQVGDIRRMVDEFSDFARMPKPIFREENIGELLRQSLFLHEVSRPDIHFEAFLPDPPRHIICDRRLLAQAFTNIIKNAVEAIDRAGGSGGAIVGVVEPIDDRLAIQIVDNGAGLPDERANLVEPYVTTREGGTGLGLAIVKKIVEDHAGELTLRDNAGGGTQVVITLWPGQLAAHRHEQNPDQIPPPDIHEKAQ